MIDIGNKYETEGMPLLHNELTYINTSNTIFAIFGHNIACRSYIPFLVRVWED